MFNVFCYRNKIFQIYFLVFLACWMFLGLPCVWASSSLESFSDPKNHLHRAKIYLAAGDYRRAVEACQSYIDLSPSVESYVYLIYVYEATDGYLGWLAKQDDWVKVGQLSSSMVNRGTIELVDPPNMLARMAKELLHEGLRHQFDITAAMANRLDKTRVNQLWGEQKLWRENHPDNWWAGVPKGWEW